MTNAPNNSFSRHFMLKKRNEINNLFSKGEKQICSCFNIYTLIGKNESCEIKIFISIPKKNVPKANKRNLIKRRLKENIRINLYDLQEICKNKNISIFVAFVYNKKFIEEFSTIKETINKKFIKIKQDIINENI